MRFRVAVRGDVAAIVALLADDLLGQTRESSDLSPYLDMFDRIAGNEMHEIVVGDNNGDVMACYQISFLDGLSLRATRRAQIEGVRVSSALRGRGYGTRLLLDAELRARAAGCSLLQFTTNAGRKDAHRFYERQGYEPSHVGFKKRLD